MSFVVILTTLSRRSHDTLVVFVSEAVLWHRGRSSPWPPSSLGGRLVAPAVVALEVATLVPRRPCLLAFRPLSAMLHCRLREANPRLSETPRRRPPLVRRCGAPREALASLVENDVDSARRDRR